VRYAVGTDTELPMLTGVLLDVDGDAVRLAATDRYRLAVSALSGAEVAGPPVTALVPVALVDELLAALPADGPVAIDVASAELTAGAGRGAHPVAPLAIRAPERAGDIAMLMPIRLT
jgi:DNA polymerase III sliding clamp (beta) subunit (PCNA family)